MANARGFGERHPAHHGPPARGLPPTLRPLSESEIHDRLYGEYHADRRRSRPVVVDPVPLSPVTAPPGPLSEPPSERPWTGQEILGRELSRLSEELTALQQQRERLAGRRNALRPSPSGSGVWVLVGALLVASAGAAVVCHSVLLEAQPPVLAGPPGSLYSVQVGVYQGRAAADRFAQTLSQQGHAAFVMATPSRQGPPRYRVYVGRFASKVEAQVQLDRIRRDPLLKDSFVLRRR